MGFPCGSADKESTCNAGDLGLTPGLGRSPGEGIGYPPQYSWTSLVAQKVKNLPAVWETWVWPLDWEDPWRRAWQPTLVFLPGEFHAQRSLEGHSPWGCKEWLSTHIKAMGLPRWHSGKEPACQSRRHETRVQSLGWEDPWRRAWQPTPVFLPEKSHGQGSLVDYGP